jgi:hypothetical protein
MAVLFILGCLQPARAALFSISGLNDEPLPGTLNDLIPTPNAEFRALVPGGGAIADPDLSGLFTSGGAQLSTTAANVAITYDYIGSFAEASNIFTTGGASFRNSGVGERGGGDAVAQPRIEVVQPVPGPVDFAFSTSIYGGSSVANIAGNNPVGGGAVNYLMAYLEPRGVGGDWKLTGTAGSVVLILFDDGGRGPDRNDYDDLGIIAIAAPLPASLPLFAAALGGLGLMAWRRRANTDGADPTPGERM